MSLRTLAALSLLTAATAAPSLAVAADYEVDAGHSAVLFGATHFGAGITFGRFNDFKGTYTADGDTLSDLSLEIQVASVDSNIDKRDDHLRGPDFFNAPEFPVITFKSTKVAKNAKGWDVTGDLTMHGVTQTVTLPVEKVGEGPDPWGGYRYGFISRFDVSRSAYGITHMSEGIGDTIQMIVSLEGKKKVER